MTKRCLCPAALCFLFGIVLSVKGQMLVLIPVSILILYIGFRFYTYQMTARGIFLSAVLAVIFFFGILTGNHNDDLRGRYMGVLTDGQSVTVQGRLYKKEIKNDRIYLYLDRGWVLLENTPVSCRDIMIEAESTDYVAGNTLVITGTYTSFGRARNEGNYDEAAYNFGRGVDIKLSSPSHIEEYGKKITLREILFELQTRMKAVIQTAMPEGEAGVLAAMVLGDKTTLTPEDKTLFSEAGLSHILSVSGLHVSLLCLGLFKLLRKTHLPVILAAAASSAFALTYCLFTGENTATIRAVGMFLISMIAMAAGEAYDILSALSVLAVIVAFLNPMVIFTASFLLSFGAVLGIAVAGRELGAFYKLLVKRKNAIRTIKRRIEESKKKAESSEQSLFKNLGQNIARRLRTFAEGIFETILVNIGIILMTLPLVAWFYYEVPTLSLIVNLIVVPLMGALLCLGFFGSLAGCGVFAFGAVVLLPCRFILSIYKNIAALSGQIPFSTWIIGRPSMAGIIIFYSLLFAFLAFLHHVRLEIYAKNSDEIYFAGKERVNIPLYGAAVLLLTLLLAIILRAFVPHGPQIVMLDVDQGDGIYIKTDNKETVFIDGGSTGIKSCGKYRILPFLKSRGEAAIDYWFVSHADEDHVSGIEEILEDGYRVKNLVISPEIYRDENTEKLLYIAKEHNVNVIRMRQGDRFVYKNDSIICLFPSDGYDAEDANTSSLVLLYETEGFDMLFTGDMGHKEERKLMKHMSIASDKPLLLKVAHHGSKNSSDSEFLESISPKAALISVGVKHPYGHPHKETIDKLEDLNTDIYRTDMDGEIVVMQKKGKLMIKRYLGEEPAKE